MARDHQSYLHLGFVRLADYAAERLGMSLRSVQELIRVEEALAALPGTAAAVESGEITASHIRLLSRVATAETEPFWLARARRMSVRAFRQAVAAALERAVAEIASAGAGVGAGAGGAPAVASEAAPSGNGPAHQGKTNPMAGALDDIDREDERVALTLRAPAWLLRWWRETVTLASRITGSPLGSGDVLDVVLAEAADAAETPADDDPNGTLTRSVAGCEMAPGQGSTVDRTDGAGTVRAPGDAGRRAGGGRSIVTEGPTRDPDPAVSPPPDPRELDARLRELVTARQRCEAALADRLACARAARNHLSEGFRSLEAYASRRLGLAPRRMYHLLSLHRTMERLPGLRRAFLDGRLTLRQALLVGRVASRETDHAWIRRARAVTLRRLEDEVEYWELLRVERPEVWDRLRGGPIPEALVLVPGHEPRLHASARAATGVEDHDPTLVDTTPGQHGCAPDETGTGNRTTPAASRESGLHMSARAASGAEGPDEDVVNSENGLHVCAPESPVDAQAFLAALQASEAKTALPQRMGTLRMRVDPEVQRSWREVLRRLRSRCDGPLQEWEALALILRRFWQVWDNEESRRKRREQKTLERDGWRCTAPGCRAVGSGKLHEHHIVFRSAGGPLTDPANLTAQCSAHHQRLIHRGVIRCRGEAPDRIRWEMGVESGQQAFLIYTGDRRVGGTAPPSRVQHHALAGVTPLRQ